MALIFVLSHEPSTESSVRSGQIVEVVQPYISALLVDDVSNFVRKSAHIIAYFILGALVFNVIRYYGVSKKWLLLCVFIAGSYAISDEIHQTFVEGRSGEVRDVLIDTIAASAGIGGLYLYKKRQIDTTSDKMV